MSVLLLYSKQYQALRTLVMGLDGMDLIFQLQLFTSLMPLLYSKQFQALRTLVMGLDGMDVIFKLATVPSLMFLTWFKQFQVLRTVKNPHQGSIWGRRDIFKLETLHELDNVSNLNQSIWVLLTPHGFSRNVILGPTMCIVI